MTTTLPDLGHLGAVPYHVGYATRDLGAAMAAFGPLFDLEWAPPQEGLIDGLGPADTTGWTSKRVVSLDGPVHTELTEGSADSIWATGHLAELHHLAYWCADLAGSVRALQDEGWELELTLPGGGGEATEFAYLARAAWPRLELVDLRRQAAFVEANRHQGPVGRAGVAR